MIRIEPDYKCPVCNTAVYIKENPESRGQWRAKCYWCGLKTDWTASREDAATAWENLNEQRTG